MPANFARQQKKKEKRHLRWLSTLQIIYYTVNRLLFDAVNNENKKKEPEPLASAQQVGSP